MSYLCRIGRRYYFRIRIPQDVQRHFPLNEIKKSLRKGELREARVAVKAKAYQIEKIFTLTRSSMLTDEQISKLVDQYLNDKDFKEFIRLSGMTHVKTSPYYPQSNGKLDRFHKTLKGECIRPKTPPSLDDAKSL